MFIARIPNRNSPPAFLLRESYRDHGKVKTRTLANLSKLPCSIAAIVGASPAQPTMAASVRSAGRHQAHV